MTDTQATASAKSQGAQRWDPAAYQRDAGFVSELGADVLSWLAPCAGETILDLGCGDGALAERIAASGAQVRGVDASAAFVAAARARGIDATVMDGHALTFDRTFDAVFSNAALHWMTDAQSVARGVASALKPGGRFVAEFGGHGNVAAIVTALRAAARIHGGREDLAHPWYFPTPTAYTRVLQDVGLTVERIAHIPRPTPLPTGMAAWLKVFRAPFFEQFAPQDRPAVERTVLDLLSASLCDEAGQWTADYVRLRVAARLVP